MSMQKTGRTLLGLVAVTLTFGMFAAPLSAAEVADDEINDEYCYNACAWTQEQVDRVIDVLRTSGRIAENTATPAAAPSSEARASSTARMATTTQPSPAKP